jgi:hypothetical protein
MTNENEVLKEDMDVKREMNQMFIDDINKGRRIYLQTS